MNKFIKSSVIAFLAITIMFGLTGSAKAVTTTVDLGDAGRFVILSHTGITDTPTSAIIGNIGVSPTTGASITGIVQSQVTGSIYTVAAAGPSGNVVDPTLLTSAKNDLTTAYTDAANRTVTATVASELGGQTLTSGVYNSLDTEFGITGTLILDGQDDTNAVFIFEAADDQASSLTVNSGSIVSLINGASACNVFWRVNGATIDTTATFKGNILSHTSITVNDGADIEGRLLAETGNVTLINDTIAVGVCAAAYTPSTATDTATTELPSTGDGSSNMLWVYMGIGTIVVIGLIIFLVTRKKKDIPQQPQQQ